MRTHRRRSQRERRLSSSCIRFSVSQVLHRSSCTCADSLQPTSRAASTRFELLLPLLFVQSMSLLHSPLLSSMHSTSRPRPKVPFRLRVSSASTDMFCGAYASSPFFVVRDTLAIRIQAFEVSFTSSTSFDVFSTIFESFSSFCTCVRSTHQHCSPSRPPCLCTRALL